MFSVFRAFERGLLLLQAGGMRFFVEESAFAEWPETVGDRSEAGLCQSWTDTDFAPTA